MIEYYLNQLNHDSTALSNWLLPSSGLCLDFEVVVQFSIGCQFYGSSTLLDSTSRTTDRSNTIGAENI
jgi:hypothetical protein